VEFKEQKQQEHAEWIRDEAGLRRALGPAWQKPTILQTDELDDQEIYRRAVLKDGSFVAVLDVRERFIKLIDRLAAADASGRAAAQLGGAKGDGQ
jgi:hypothetical protein